MSVLPVNVVLRSKLAVSFPTRWVRCSETIAHPVFVVVPLSKRRDKMEGYIVCIQWLQQYFLHQKTTNAHATRQAPAGELARQID